ncbi:hypothetical protein KQX54_011473 [Cotesia glomerata]|uniref:Uncharacterized protein n=1 Tax=Cotesia glomerata TaxID=32391 RepID=A0AAV7J3C5_COTGL|nr:hypothetical protein KQX54_011473 [Cotesia glomerata]
MRKDGKLHLQRLQLQRCRQFNTYVITSLTKDGPSAKKLDAKSIDSFYSDVDARSSCYSARLGVRSYVGV